MDDSEIFRTVHHFSAHEKSITTGRQNNALTQSRGGALIRARVVHYFSVHDRATRLLPRPNLWLHTPEPVPSRAIISSQEKKTTCIAKTTKGCVPRAQFRQWEEESSPSPYPLFDEQIRTTFCIHFNHPNGSRNSRTKSTNPGCARNRSNRAQHITRWS